LALADAPSVLVRPESVLLTRALVAGARSCAIFPSMNPRSICTLCREISWLATPSHRSTSSESFLWAFTSSLMSVTSLVRPAVKAS
jgi:hypothetical protein